MNGLLCLSFGSVKISLWTFLFIGAILYADFSFFTFEVLLAAALHECGHLLAMKLLGVKFHSVTVLPYGAVIYSDASLLPYRKEAVVAIAGIMLNLLSGTVSLIIWFFSKDIYTLFFFVCSMFLALINLIPVKTFDGARAAEAFIAEHYTAEMTKRIMDTVYYFSFLALVLLSLWVLNVTDGNFSMVIFLVYVFICIYAQSEGEDS